MSVQVNKGVRKLDVLRGPVFCQVIGSVNVCSFSLGRYFLIGCCEQYGSQRKPMYKPGHSVAVNSAWFSSHSYVEDRRQPDL